MFLVVLFLLLGMGAVGLGAFELIRRRFQVERHLRKDARTAFDVGAWMVARPIVDREPDLGQAILWGIITAFAWPVWVALTSFFVLWMAQPELLAGYLVGTWLALSFGGPMLWLVGVLLRRDSRQLGWERLALTHRGMTVDRVWVPFERETSETLQCAASLGMEHNVPWHEVDGVVWQRDDVVYIETNRGWIYFGPLPTSIGLKLEAEISKRCDGPAARKPDAAIRPLFEVLSRSARARTGT